MTVFTDKKKIAKHLIELAKAAEEEVLPKLTDISVLVYLKSIAYTQYEVSMDALSKPINDKELIMTLTIKALVEILTELPKSIIDTLDRENLPEQISLKMIESLYTLSQLESEDTEETTDSEQDCNVCPAKDNCLAYSAQEDECPSTTDTVH